MSEIKKLWIKITHGSGFPFWESEITDDEHLKSDYEDFDSSLCVVPLSALEAEKAKVEKLKNALSNALIAADFFKNHADCNRESYFSCSCSFCKGSSSKDGDLRECRQTLKEIEAMDSQNNRVSGV